MRVVPLNGIKSPIYSSNHIFGIDFSFRTCFQTSADDFVGFHRQVSMNMDSRWRRCFSEAASYMSCLQRGLAPTSLQTNYFNICPQIVILHIVLDRSLLIALILLSGTINLNYTVLLYVKLSGAPFEI